MLGRAEESVDSAPTHQTVVPVVAEKGRVRFPQLSLGAEETRTRDIPRRTTAPTMITHNGVALISRVDRFFAI